MIIKYNTYKERVGVIMKKNLIIIIVLFISLFLITGCTLFESEAERRERELNEELERSQKELEDSMRDYAETQDAVNKYNYYRSRVDGAK